jgi:hypothetical protein
VALYVGGRLIGLHGATIRFVAQGSTRVIYKLSLLVSPNVVGGMMIKSSF